MIIGVVGFIGSGKGTFGDILAEKHGFIRESFAQPVKDCIANIFGWDREMLEGSTKASREWREQIDLEWSAKLGKEISPRLALQWMGTEAGRNVFGENLWTASCMNRCRAGSNYVITDTRFNNEIAAIRENNGIVVRVKRGDEPPHYRAVAVMRHEEYTQEQIADWMKAIYPLVHISEWDWIGTKFDIVVDNDGSIANLESKVHDILTTSSLVNRLNKNFNCETITL